MKDGTVVSTFNGNVATYKVKIPQVLTYKATDAYGNVVNNEIDLTKYIVK